MYFVYYKEFQAGCISSAGFYSCNLFALKVQVTSFYSCMLFALKVEVTIQYSSMTSFLLHLFLIIILMHYTLSLLCLIIATKDYLLFSVRPSRGQNKRETKLIVPVSDYKIKILKLLLNHHVIFHILIGQ